MIQIRVPATTANLGPGFDSCGLALTLYLTLTVESEHERWQIVHHLNADIPQDKSNLIIQTALTLAPHLKPHKLKMTSNIPTARGLGSSSAAIVAGIELANVLADLQLKKEEKIKIASEIEGHPDNVAPAILGSFVVTAKSRDRYFYTHHPFPNCGVLAFVPQNELLTAESRKVLPEQMAFKEAIQGSSLANVMVSALLTENMPLAGKMIESDLWHEQQRSRLVPYLNPLRLLARKKGAYGTCLSGAGPTILTLLPKEKMKEIQQTFEQYDKSATVYSLQVDCQGVTTHPESLKRPGPT